MFSPQRTFKWFRSMSDRTLKCPWKSKGRLFTSRVLIGRHPSDFAHACYGCMVLWVFANRQRVVERFLNICEV
jgi:hypothetical protein